MNNEIVLLLEALLSLGIAIFFVYLSMPACFNRWKISSEPEDNRGKPFRKIKENISKKCIDFLSEIGYYS